MTAVPAYLRIGEQEERNVGHVERSNDPAEFQRRVAALLRGVANEIEQRSVTPDG